MEVYTSSDWHLRSTVPVSRAEKSWYDVMQSRINQIKQIVGDNPIVVAGDLFDRPDPPASLVSWAIEALKGLRIYCIVGQHDILNHRISDRLRGAYGALVKAGTIVDLPINDWYPIPGSGVWAYGMPWGMYDVPVGDPKGFRLGVIHKYAWVTEQTKHVGVDGSTNVLAMSKYMKHFDAMVIGDNHISWTCGKFLNHGSLLSMTSAQKEHVPYLGRIKDNSFTIIPFPETSPQWQPGATITADESIPSSLLSLTATKGTFVEHLAAMTEGCPEDDPRKPVYQQVYHAVLNRD